MDYRFVPMISLPFANWIRLSITWYSEGRSFRHPTCISSWLTFSTSVRNATSNVILWVLRTEGLMIIQYTPGFVTLRITEEEILQHVMPHHVQFKASGNYLVFKITFCFAFSHCWETFLLGIRDGNITFVFALLNLLFKFWVIKVLHCFWVFHYRSFVLTLYSRNLIDEWIYNERSFGLWAKMILNLPYHSLMTDVLSFLGEQLWI